MGTVSGQGTTFGLPNYHGELFTVTPTDTPFLSAIGGLSGAKIVHAKEFEWQTIDRRSSSANNSAEEGQAAPSGAERSRSNVSNVVEIHQSAIELSYTKLAATGQFSGVNVGPQFDDATIDELVTQTMAELESMAVDIELSFLKGVYSKPSDNSSPRATRGVLSAIATNLVNGAVDLGAGTIVASTGVFTITGGAPATALTVGSPIYLGPITSTTGVSAATRYYIKTVPSSSTFTLSATKGGSALSLTTDGSTTHIYQSLPVAKANLDGLLSTAFTNGAKLAQDTTVIMVGPAQKTALSNAYSIPALNQTTLSRTIGGIAMDTLVTDFGTFAVMLNRWMDADKIAVVDLSVCQPVFLEIPGKGLLFTEELARTGAARKFQLYGEVGLEYGPETYHALLTDLA